MASLPYRTAMGTGGLAGIFGPPGPGLFEGGAPTLRQTGTTNRKPVGYGIGGHPFYNLVAYHQSRAYRFRGGRPGQNPFQPQPPMGGGNPPRLNPPPPPAPRPLPPGPVFSGGAGELPIGPEQPQTAIYYNPLGAPAPVQHPALALARLLNG